MQEIVNGIAFIVAPIFYKMVYMSIVATVIGIIICIVKKIFSNEISAKWNKSLWIIFIIALLVPINIRTRVSIYNFIPIELEKIQEVSYSQQNISNEIKSVDISAKKVEDISENNQVEKTNIKTKINFKELIYNKILPILWINVILIIYLIMIISYIIFNKKIGKKYVTEERILKIFEKTKTELGINRDIKLIEQEYINTPAIIGIFNVKILVNKNFYKMKDNQIKYILIHELSHYMQKDNAINIIINNLRIIYWFNPIISLICNQIRKDIEISADDKATNYIEIKEHKNYCMTLIETSNLESNIKVIPKVLKIGDNKKNLKRRIKMVNLKETFSKNKILIGILVVSILILLAVFFMTRKQEKEEIVINNTLNTLTNTDIANNVVDNNVEKNTINNTTTNQVSNEIVNNTNTVNKTTNNTTNSQTKVTLDKSELALFKTYFNNYNGFFTCEYDKPEKIDLRLVLYNGANFGIKVENLTTEEKNDILKDILHKTEENEQLETDGFKLETKKINEYLLGTIGFKMDKISNNTLTKSYYLSKYDSYYLLHGDTNATNIEVVDGYKQNGVYNINYKYSDGYYINDKKVTKGTITLKQSGDKYLFISNKVQ